MTMALKKHVKMSPICNSSTEVFPHPEQFPTLVISVVLKARKPNQKYLREQLHQLKKQIEKGQHMELDPLHTLPEELWVIIRDKLDVVNCANCAQAHFLFYSITNSSPQELLFAKALPVLVPYFGDDCAVAIVTCGTVCRNWRLAIKHFANEYFRTALPSLDSFEAITKERVTYYPRKNLLKNLPIIYTDIEHQKAMFPISKDLPQFPSFCLINLSHGGKFVYELTLELHLSQTDIFTTQHLSWRCMEVFRNCTNLKSFTITEIVDPAKRCTIKSFGGNEHEKLQIPKSLETLELQVGDERILPFQTPLIQTVSSQLTCLKLRHWHPLYIYSEWDRLLQLEILESKSVETLTSLQILEAPNLYKLYLQLDVSCKFSQVLKVINKFQNLRHLCLSLTTAYTVNVFAVPLKLLTGNRITTLEIYCHDLTQVQNIPVLFPLLRNMIWHYTLPSKKITLMEFEKLGMQIKSATSTSSSMHFIQLYQNMYNSNIWKLLPRLETLTLNNITQNQNKEPITTVQKFVRRGYRPKTSRSAAQVAALK